MFHEVYETMNEMRLDIQVIPRQDTYFNKAKSNLKFLESSMLEIPVIAQSFPDGLSPYEVDPEDAKYMILCRTQDEFVTAIRELSADKALRREMGRKAKEYVTEKYDIEKNAYKWEEAYQSLFKKL